MRVTLSLLIDVVLELNGENVQEAIDRIEAIPTRLAGEGLLTGDGPAEVVRWESRVYQAGT